MRVVLDTNVVIAAFATRGLCTSVIELCLDRHVLLLSEHVVQEVTENLERKIRLRPQIVREVERFLRSVGQMVSPVPLSDPVCRDAEDDLVLALAVDGAADVIVSGDKDLLVLGKYGTVSIMTPRAFWESQRPG
jgi:putative PIN family toxin of toxin-antitoxin system